VTALVTQGLVTQGLVTQGLGRRYGRIWALRDCHLTVPAGHVAALVGPNGAGKTTLLHLAVGRWPAWTRWPGTSSWACSWRRWPRPACR